MLYIYVRPSFESINDTLKAGGDPKALELHLNPWGDKKGNGRSIACFHCLTHYTFHSVCCLRYFVHQDARIDDDAEISKKFGTHATAIAIRRHFERNINPNAKALNAASERGDDPKDVNLVGGVGNHGNPGKGQTV